ncbi:Receptor-like serine/threonine-protein kinase SD1-6 [Capsicum annuum]|uniref:non-specific serine/threonine protein kinase n=1 Tax=Capsicum annuum TaxID=4072 RepID=A0A2G2Z592_CAPAN|nr:Receptor-like serine/threonine-protein kinase SD1-6 [Capsicum annuum]
MLNPNGVIQLLTWVDGEQAWVPFFIIPGDNCDTYKLCGSYGSCNSNDFPVLCGCLDKFVPKNSEAWNKADWSGGCVRRTQLNCSQGDVFLKYSQLKLPDTRNSWSNVTMTLEECKNMCSKNCSCMAYSNADIRDGGSECLLWFNDLLDIRQVPKGGLDIYIRVAASESDDSLERSNGKKGKALIWILASSVGVILVLLSMLIYHRRRKKVLELKRRGRLGHSGNCAEEFEIPLFDLSTIAKATNNFSIDVKIGEGGFGPVYKGKLEGQEIAVKRLSRTSTQGENEFKNEVLCIAKLQHRNLVKIIGCCVEGEEKMLIYEYLPNGSLDSFIFDDTQNKVLDWPKRFHIINSIARGLLYLHQDSQLRIIHRDLKANNILLDKDMNPKISDFGLAKICEEDDNEAKTNRVVGTRGYLSPEYALQGLYSVKSDVFSFGILVLEIVSGKSNRRFSHPDHYLNLLGHAWKIYKEGRSIELLDERLSDTCSRSEVERSICVGLLCVQQCPEDRPSMSSVVFMLNNEGVLPQAKQPGFYIERNTKEVEFSSNQHANVTATEIKRLLLMPSPMCSLLRVPHRKKGGYLVFLYGLGQSSLMSYLFEVELGPRSILYMVSEPGFVLSAKFSLDTSFWYQLVLETGYEQAMGLPKNIETILEVSEYNIQEQFEDLAAQQLDLRATIKIRDTRESTIMGVKELISEQNVGQQVRHPNPEDENLGEEEFLDPGNLRRVEQIAKPVQRNANRNRPFRGRQDHQQVQDDVNDDDDVIDGAGATGGIIPPLLVPGEKFNITSTMIQLLNLKGLFGDLPGDDPNLHLVNFVTICKSFDNPRVGQNAIRLRLFSLSLSGEATLWLNELTPMLSLTEGS